jgi:hypothetical protein
MFYVCRKTPENLFLNRMNFFESSNARLFIFFLLLAVFTCSPIWAVEYFINQDGSGHVYSASLMTELLKGNPAVTEVYTFNSFSFPNSSGHWILVLLLLVFSPFTVTKIIATLTYLGLVAACGWLRWKTVGREGVVTSFLIGAAIGFNWLWMYGFYNFLIGVIAFTLTLGIYYGWRENMNWARALGLSALLVLVYISHIVSFGILAGSVCLMSVFVAPAKLKKTLLWTFVAFLPIVPLLLIYRSLSEAGGGFSPVWRYLSDPYSLVSWLNQWRNVDFFILISRKTFPFTNFNSKFLAVFTPSLWITVATVCLSIAGFFYFRRNRELLKKYYPFALIFGLFIFIVLFSPDDFSWKNGGILRERFFLCAFIVFVPLFRVQDSIWLKRLAHFCLAVVIVFQTLALWEYSLAANRIAKEFLPAGAAIKENEKLAAVTIVEDGLRFHALPTGQMDNYFGIGRNVQVWDNYEIGHYLFPIMAKNPADRQFVFDYTRNNFFPLNSPPAVIDEKLKNLDASLQENHGKITTMLVWGSEPRVEAVLNKWFESEPYYQNGQVRLFRHR